MIDFTPLLRLKRLVAALRREPNQANRVRMWGMYFRLHHQLKGLQLQARGR